MSTSTLPPLLARPGTRCANGHRVEQNQKKCMVCEREELMKTPFKDLPADRQICPAGHVLKRTKNGKGFDHDCAECRCEANEEAGEPPELVAAAVAARRSKAEQDAALARKQSMAAVIARRAADDLEHEGAAPAFVTVQPSRSVMTYDEEDEVNEGKPKSVLDEYRAWKDRQSELVEGLRAERAKLVEQIFEIDTARKKLGQKARRSHVGSNEAGYAAAFEEKQATGLSVRELAAKHNVPASGLYRYVQAKTMKPVRKTA